MPDAPLGRAPSSPLIELRSSEADLAAERAAVVAGLRDSRSRYRAVTSTTSEARASSRRSTELPEYYPTRTERAILERSAAGIARHTRASQPVELGSGSAAKTRLLLGRWVEMRLLAREAHRVALGDGTAPLDLAAGEAIRPGISAK